MNSDLAAQRALDKLRRTGAEALTEKERTLATVWLFESKVANGGFSHYYASPAGNLAIYAPAALRSIGATQLAEIAAEANAIFGADGPPMDREARKVAMDRLHDAARTDWENLEARFFKCEDDIDELLDAYLDQRRELVR